MKKKKGLTLTEILIAIAVVGVIAVVSGMIINTNIRKTEIETKLKQTISVLNRALYRAITDNGPAYTWNAVINKDSSSRDRFEYFNKYLMPYLHILKPPKVTSLQELGYPNGIKQANGGTWSIVGENYKDKMIFLNDGTIILNTVFSASCTNKNCSNTTITSVQHTIDINGPKGPNVYGKDVFNYSVNLISDVPTFHMAGTLYFDANSYETTGEVTIGEYSRSTLIANCKGQGFYCGALIEKNGWKIPNDYPLKL